RSLHDGLPILHADERVGPHPHARRALRRILGAVGHAQPSTNSVSRTERMRSSSADGSPRPSVLLVTNQSDPSAAGSTSRIRPNSPVNQATGSSPPPAVG